jgi:hypothetical protein
VIRKDARFCDGCGETLAVQEAPLKTVEIKGKEVELPKFLADVQYDLVETPKKERNDALLAVRVILLLATGLCIFTAPWLVALFFGVAWLVSLVWPSKN